MSELNEEYRDALGHLVRGGASNGQLDIIEAVLEGRISEWKIREILEDTNRAWGLTEAMNARAEKSTTCPDCGGSGKFDINHREWRWGGHRNDLKQGDDCPTCKGTGRVEVVG